MSRFVLPVVLLLLASGCTADQTPDPATLPFATGLFGELIVVSDSATWKGPVGAVLRSDLGPRLRTLNVLEGEPQFDVRLRTLEGGFYNQLQKQRCVVFAALLDQPGAVGDFIRERLGAGVPEAIRAGGPTAGIIRRDDLWAQGQVFFYATAADTTTLIAGLRQKAPEIRAACEGVTNRAVARDMFGRARQTDLEAQLFERHGFALTIQHDYFFSQDTTVRMTEGTTGRFVRLRRVLQAEDTWRDLYVYYEDAAAPPAWTSADLQARLNRLGERFLRGTLDSSFVQVEDRRPVVATDTTLAGRPALALRGLWRMENDLMGGPFVSYAFYDAQQQRAYLFYGMVFAPGFEKREFVRQLEIIAHTFRTTT